MSDHSVSPDLHSYASTDVLFQIHGPRSWSELPVSGKRFGPQIETGIRNFFSCRSSRTDFPGWMIFRSELPVLCFLRLRWWQNNQFIVVVVPAVTVLDRCCIQLSISRACRKMTGIACSWIGLTTAFGRSSECNVSSSRAFLFLPHAYQLVHMPANQNSGFSKRKPMERLFLRHWSGSANSTRSLSRGNAGLSDRAKPPGRFHIANVLERSPTTLTKLQSASSRSSGQCQCTVFDGFADDRGEVGTHDLRAAGWSGRLRQMQLPHRFMGGCGVIKVHSSFAPDTLAAIYRHKIKNVGGYGTPHRQEYVEWN